MGNRDTVRQGQEGEAARILELLRPKLLRPVAPYAALAPIYDGVMRHVNYRRWADYVRDLASMYGVLTGKVLDVACGTGSFLEHFVGKAFLGFGCDGSQAMVRQARRKLTGKSPVRLLWVADMRRLGTAGPFDLVVCLYDSVNYLQQLQDYDQFFSEAARVLRRGGLLVFDVCTVENSVLHFNPFQERGRVGRMEYFRLSYFDPSTGLQVNEFLIGRKGNLENEAVIEIHRQWIRPLDLVRERLGQSPLELLGQFDDYSFRPGTEESLRVHFVCRRV
ncbi:MAG: class I SAM-dependent methyltransferase [candidate division KSB1 bacterium]|nr:class I SAM-dependent methyltransferase [candidate division KSB1 bacterium]